MFFLKVSLAIGGWTDSTGDKYGPLLTNPQKRQNFVKSAKEFIKKHNFDGLDLDLEVSEFNLIANDE